MTEDVTTWINNLLKGTYLSSSCGPCLGCSSSSLSHKDYGSVLSSRKKLMFINDKPSLGCLSSLEPKLVSGRFYSDLLFSLFSSQIMKNKEQKLRVGAPGLRFCAMFLSFLRRNSLYWSYTSVLATQTRVLTLAHCYSDCILTNGYEPPSTSCMFSLLNLQNTALSARTQWQ